MISKKDIEGFEEKHRLLLKANEFICLLPHPHLREYISNYNITFPTKDLMPHDFSAGNITVQKLSNDIHYSERQLNRIFRQHVGASAKSFSRLIRINHAFRLLKKSHVSLDLISDMAGVSRFAALHPRL